MLLVLSDKGKGMQSSSEQPLVGEDSCEGDIVGNMANLRALAFRTFLLLCLAHLSSGKLKVGDLNSSLWCRLGIRSILCWKHVLAVCLKCFSGWILLQLERYQPYETHNIRPRPTISSPDLKYQAPTYNIRPPKYAAIPVIFKAFFSPYSEKNS